MLQFILIQVLLISLGVVLFVVVRSLPRLDEETPSLPKQTVLERLVVSGITEKADTLFNVYMGKFLRRTKITLLRFDNYLTQKLKDLHMEVNGNGKPKIDFKEITGEVKEGETLEGQPTSLV